jgi:hypothetical protein
MSAKIRVLTVLVACFAVLMVFQPAARADVQMTLMTTPFGQTSPYQFQVDTSLLWLVCNDDYDTISIGSTWHANVLKGSDADFDTKIVATDFAGDVLADYASLLLPTPDLLRLYDVDAYLKLELYSAFYAHNTNAQTVYSNAVWQLFKPSMGVTVGDAALTAAKAAAPVGYRQLLTIYDPSRTGLIEGGYGTGNEPQQFESVPDGGVTLMLLGGALVGLETLRRRFRV